MILPKGLRELSKFALDVIDQCNVTRGQRATAYRHYGMWIESGQARQSPAGPSNYLALANMLYAHVDRLASHLFSPTDLRFGIDYENAYPKQFLERAKTASRVLSREWEANDIDVDFGHSVKEALYYGASIPKLNCKKVGTDPHSSVKVECDVVMPWNFGVLNESRNGLDRQEAVCETLYINQYEVWRQIRNLPNANELWKRIWAHSRREGAASLPSSFMHQVLSTAVLDVQSRNPTRPGGIVNMTNMPTYPSTGPTVAIDIFPMYELWVRDDDRDDDYTTIQIIEPDILVTPTTTYRKNLFVPNALPYGLVQPNVVEGYFWGRAEVVDLLQLQDWLTEHLIDLRRLVEMQVEKFIGFEGVDSITDEIYGQMRRPGYVSVPPGAKINDLTPPFPEQMIPVVQLILQLMDKVSGFPPILSGEGQPGVRAQSHADQLMRTGSPRLRDRSLLVERQCAAFADSTFAALRDKDGRFYWTNPDDEKDRFLLADLPDDYRVSVDSHSTSPIYHDDHANLVSWGVRTQVLGPEDAIEDLPFSHKDIKLQRLKEREAAKAKMMQEHPEMLEGKDARKNLRAV
jgi:hypothetical protein